MLQTKGELEKLDRSIKVLRALSHKLRIRLLNFIHQNGPVSVYEIFTTLNYEQSITSQNLRILREADLVITQREGKVIYYLPNNKRLIELGDLIVSFDQKTLDNRKKTKKK